MQARLPLTVLDPSTAMNPGSKLAAPKPGAEEEFAGLLLASEIIAGQVTPVSGETAAKITVATENPEGVSEGEPTAAEESEAAGGFPILADLWKSPSLGPAPVKIDPNLPDGDHFPAAKIPPQTDAAEPASTTGTSPAAGAEVGFAGSVAVDNVLTAPVVAADPIPESRKVPGGSGTAETETATIANAEVASDGKELQPLAAKSILPVSTDSTQNPQKLETQRPAGRPLEVADVLALKARHLRRLAAEGGTAKPTYEDPRLSGERIPASGKAEQLPSQGPENRIPVTTPEGLSGKLAVPVTVAQVDGVQDSQNSQSLQNLQGLQFSPISQNSQSLQNSQLSQAAVAADAEFPVPAQELPAVESANLETQAAPAGNKGQQKETPTEGKADSPAVPLTNHVARPAMVPSAEPAGSTEHAGSGEANATGKGSSLAEGPSARTAAPVFRQVVENIDMQSTGSRVKIQLNPEHLGRVEVSLVARNNVLEVRIVADNPQAAQSLQGNLHELTEGLKAKAVHYQHLDVQVESRETVRIKPEDGQPDRRDQQRGQERQGGDGRQDGSRERGRRENRSENGRESQAWSWFDMKEEA